MEALREVLVIEPKLHHLGPYLTSLEMNDMVKLAVLLHPNTYIGRYSVKIRERLYMKLNAPTYLAQILTRDIGQIFPSLSGTDLEKAEDIFDFEVRVLDAALGWNKSDLDIMPNRGQSRFSICAATLAKIEDRLYHSPNCNNKIYVRQYEPGYELPNIFCFDCLDLLEMIRDHKPNPYNSLEVGPDISDLILERYSMEIKLLDKCHGQ